MGERVDFSLSIHGAPVRVRANPENGGAVTLYFGAHSFPDITMFVESAEMAIDLHAAISGVIEKHAARPALSEQEAA